VTVAEVGRKRPAGHRDGLEASRQAAATRPRGQPGINY